MLNLTLNSIIKSVESTLSEDPNLFNFLSQNAYIAGGAVRDVIDFNESYNDIDIFFYTKDAADKIATYDFSKFQHFDVKKHPNGTVKIGEISIITRYYGSIEDILMKFDFNVNQRALTFTGDLVVPKAYLYLKHRVSHLVINNNARNKVGTLLRLARFEDMYPSAKVENSYKSLLIFNALKQVNSQIQSLEDLKAIADAGSGKGDMWMIPKTEDLIKSSPLLEKLQELKDDNTYVKFDIPF